MWWQPSDSKPPDSSNVPPQIPPQPCRTITTCKTQRKQGEAPQQFAEPETPLPFFISKLLQCPVCKQHEQFLCYTTVVSYHAKHKANLPRPPACRPGPFPQQCVVNPSLGKWEWNENGNGRKSSRRTEVHQDSLNPSSAHDTKYLPDCLAPKAEKLNVRFLCLHQDTCL